MYSRDHAPLARLREAAAKRRALGLRRQLDPRGQHDTLLDLASNDYLGLSGHPRLADAAAAAARARGVGATGSRLVTGTTTLHADLERDLAAYACSPAALVFSSGYLANLATVTALARALGSVRIVSDEVNHASLVDACRLARSATTTLTVTPHGDVRAVRKALATRTEDHAIVVTDAVFSVDGDLAPLAGLHAAAAEHNALLVIDEAHSLGVLGTGGRGAADAAGIAADPRVVRTITLSKSLAGQGGAVLGVTEVIQTLVDTGRGFIFDTGLAPPSVAAAAEALALLREDPAAGARAMGNAARLARLARGFGLDATSPQAAVVAVIMGDAATAVGARDVAAAHGVRVGCFRPPSVPDGRACLRLTGKATLTENDFAAVSRALGAVRDYCGIAPKAGRNTV